MPNWVNSTRVSSLRVMGPTFQSCRGPAPSAAAQLKTLIAVLDEVQRQGALVIEAPDGLPGLPVDSTEFRPASDETNPPEEVMRHPAYARIFAVIDAGARDLARFIEAGEHKAARSLGYAMHVLPSLLVAPEEFDRRSYAFCLKQVAEHWDLMSARTREVLRELVGPKLSDAVLNEVRRY